MNVQKQKQEDLKLKKTHRQTDNTSQSSVRTPDTQTKASRLALTSKTIHRKRANPKLNLASKQNKINTYFPVGTKGGETSTRGLVTSKNKIVKLACLSNPKGPAEMDRDRGPRDPTQED